MKAIPMAVVVALAFAAPVSAESRPDFVAVWQYIPHTTDRKSDDGTVAHVRAQKLVNCLEAEGIYSTTSGDETSVAGWAFISVIVPAAASPEIVLSKAQIRRAKYCFSLAQSETLF
ncbi:hypothetical protein HYT05_04970 [Candidatus Kaiserbacteria bacterium]|nr:hypothetical protein [Candidatus Kaiserbacteria bacterium]